MVDSVMSDKIDTLKVDILKETDQSPVIVNESERKDNLFYNLPTSPVADMFLRIINAGENLSELPRRRKTVNPNQKIDIYEGGDERRVNVKSDKYNISLEISDIEKITGYNKAVKKMFIFVLIKINEQAYSNGVLRRNYVEFPLQELIDIGFYSRPQSARTGFKNSVSTLTSFKVSGTLKRKGEKAIEQSAIEVLFTGANIKNGICTVYLNERINWAFIAAFYTILPRYCFRLSNKAFDLLCYIFYLARQNVSMIEKKGWFNINMRAVQERLNLPDEKDRENPDKNINNPERDIRQPIEKAIEEIEALNNDIEFTITPVYDLDASISHYLDNGRLEIALHGKYAESFIKLSRNIAQKMQSLEKEKKAMMKETSVKALPENAKSENS